MNAYNELISLVETLGIPCSTLAMPAITDTYAVVRMVTHQAELSGDDMPMLYGAYMQIDLFTTSDADAKARSIVDAVLAAGYVYRGRSDDYLNDRQHIEIRLMKLEG
jgi:hypothetical protein